MNITPLNHIPSIQPLEKSRSSGAPAAPSAPTETTFASLLDSLDRSQGASDQLMQKLAAGEDVDLHQVMLASEQADISFRVALAIRDKLVDAYRQVSTMNV